MQGDYCRNAEKTWDAIAESFDATRHQPWDHCLEYIQTLKTTDIVADIGCGNGRHLIPCATHCRYAIGVDLSRRLLDITHHTLQKKNIRNTSLIHADAVHLPLQNNSLDAALFIASLHNIRGKNQRCSAVAELFRVLKPNGSGLISVWSRWQEKYRRFFAQQFFLNHSEFGDIDIYWRQHSLNIPRFYHLYSKREFLQELRQVGFIIETIQSVKFHSRRFTDNYFAVVRKR
jgi:tRNA (uracil-5-)-methyltransferase TRM9